MDGGAPGFVVRLQDKGQQWRDSNFVRVEDIKNKWDADNDAHMLFGLLDRFWAR